MRNNLWMALPFVILAVSAPVLFSSGERNRNSLRFWSGQIDAEGGPSVSAPGGHDRSGLWEAAVALRSGDWGAALGSALPLAQAGDPLAMEYAAWAYEALGELETAVFYWRAAGNVNALMELGQSAHQADRLEIALAAYSAAWELDPRQATARLTLVLVDLDRPAEAELVYQRALDQVGRFDRRRPGWHRGLGRLLVSQERWAEAGTAYEAALATAGYDPSFDVETVYFEIAWVYLMNGQAASAVEAIETAMVLDPSGEVYLRAGQIYEAAGNFAAALAAYRLALEAIPDSKTAGEAIERLEAGE